MRVAGGVDDRHARIGLPALDGNVPARQRAHQRDVGEQQVRRGFGAELERTLAAIGFHDLVPVRLQNVDHHVPDQVFVFGYENPQSRPPVALFVHDVRTHAQKTGPRRVGVAAANTA